MAIRMCVNSQKRACARNIYFATEKVRTFNECVCAAYKQIKMYSIK